MNAPVNAIDELRAEHEAVKSALLILGKIVEEVENEGTRSSLVRLEQLLDFFGTFVDRCHHGKEEELLFPGLEQVGISREGGPVGVMLAEHRNGRELAGRLKNAAADILTGNTDAVKTLKRDAEDYIALLDCHIEKENNILFPLAVRHLSQERIAGMKVGFDRIEAEKIGEGKHEEFHDMLNEFEKIYLD